MTKQICAAALVAAMLGAPAASAGMPVGSIGGYYTNGDFDEIDMDGLGIRGWGMVNDTFFLYGEYGMWKTDNGFDIDAIRLGGGMAGQLQDNMMWLGKAEYINLGADADASGFGIHGGLMFMATPQFHLMGTIGYLALSGDGDDSSGLELNIGGSYAFSREWSGSIDYRTYMGEYDAAGTDNEVNEIRIGVNYSFY